MDLGLLTKDMNQENIQLARIIYKETLKNITKDENSNLKNIVDIVCNDIDINKMSGVDIKNHIKKIMFFKQFTNNDEFDLIPSVIKVMSDIIKKVGESESSKSRFPRLVKTLSFISPHINNMLVKLENLESSRFDKLLKISNFIDEKHKSIDDLIKDVKISNNNKFKLIGNTLIYCLFTLGIYYAIDFLLNEDDNNNNNSKKDDAKSITRNFVWSNYKYNDENNNDQRKRKHSQIEILTRNKHPRIIDDNTNQNNNSFINHTERLLEMKTRGDITITSEKEDDNNDNTSEKEDESNNNNNNMSDKEKEDEDNDNTSEKEDESGLSEREENNENTSEKEEESGLSEREDNNENASEKEDESDLPENEDDDNNNTPEKEDESNLPENEDDISYKIYEYANLENLSLPQLEAEMTGYESKYNEDKLKICENKEPTSELINISENDKDISEKNVYESETLNKIGECVSDMETIYRTARNTNNIHKKTQKVMKKCKNSERKKKSFHHRTSRRQKRIISAKERKKLKRKLKRSASNYELSRNDNEINHNHLRKIKSDEFLNFFTQKYNS